MVETVVPDPEMSLDWNTLQQINDLAMAWPRLSSLDVVKLICF